jgi:hypothetical protein
MHKLNLFSFFAFCSAFLLSSCLTIKSFEMEVLTPASVSIPPHVKSLVIIDNTILPSDSIEIVVSGKRGQYMKFDSDTLAQIAQATLHKTLTARAFFDTVYMQPKLEYYKNKSIDKAWAAKKSLQQAVADYGADAAIVIDDISVFPSISYEEIVDGAYYHVSQTVAGKFNWVVVDLLNGSVFDLYAQSDSMFWSTYNERLVYPVPGLPRFSSSLFELANRMGYFYSDRISPNWERQVRYYFAGSSGPWELAGVCLSKNDWEQASKIWFGIYSQQRRLSKACAAHNISVAFEMAGDFDEAVKWSFEAQNLMTNFSGSYPLYKEMIDNHYEIILKRSIDARKLTEQVGG